MVGKRVRDALYIHRDAADALPPAHRERLRVALELAGPVTWNVARLETATVALLLYGDFDRDPFPALQASTRVELASGSVSARDFAATANPLILHRKEQLVSADHTQASQWRALTAALESRGLFRDPHLIGRRNAWASRLAAAGVRVEGHRLCQT